MTLAFFDFYPIITRSSTFGDLLNQASFYSLFIKSNLVVLFGFFLLSFTPFARFFKRKIMVYSVVLALIIMLGLGLIERAYLSMKLSDIWMKTSYNFVIVCLAYMMLFFIPWILKRFTPKSEMAAKFRSLPPFDLVVFLALVFVSSCAYGHLSYVPFIFVTVIYGVFLYFKSKSLKSTVLSFEFIDSLPFLGLLVLGLVGSFVKVSSIVCYMPGLREYFNCLGIH